MTLILKLLMIISLCKSSCSLSLEFSKALKSEILGKYDECIKIRNNIGYCRNEMSLETYLYITRKCSAIASVGKYDKCVHNFFKDKCAENNGGCSHICVDEGTHHFCQCKDGFKLLSDKKTCQSKNILFIHKCQIGYRDNNKNIYKYEDDDCLNRIFKVNTSPNTTKSFDYHFTFKYNPGIKSQLQVLKSFPTAIISYGITNSNITVYKISSDSNSKQRIILQNTPNCQPQHYDRKKPYQGIISCKSQIDLSNTNIRINERLCVRLSITTGGRAVFSLGKSKYRNPKFLFNSIEDTVENCIEYKKDLYHIVLDKILNKCKDSNGDCSQICLSKGNKHFCSCTDGFKLMEDGRTCKEKLLPHLYKCTISYGLISEETMMFEPNSCSDRPFENYSIFDIPELVDYNFEFSFNPEIEEEVELYETIPSVKSFYGVTKSTVSVLKNNDLLNAMVEVITDSSIKCTSQVYNRDSPFKGKIVCNSQIKLTSLHLKSGDRICIKLNIVTGGKVRFILHDSEMEQPELRLNSKIDRISRCVTIEREP
ncbi:DgyrCDS6800 [Dimorphilus gyrociliatus]|uniref:DgyrCDS6800 n=1 Tax=Dimorphilus gyrociliatus TaxID=2664684 RepID=A0A7I8VP87_9ANNE|nr:DgyrCDS6800 [Dimorphilus gyrociliatus]